MDIEARSAPAIAAIAPAQRAAAYLLRGRGASEAGSSGSEQAKGEEVEEEEAVAVLAAQLGVMAAALRGMQETLARMVEKCDPYIYYHRVRLPMSGALCRGVISTAYGQC